MKLLGILAAVSMVFAGENPDASLLSTLNAEDKAASGDAASEYRRRAALLPQVEKWRSEGNPKVADSFSLKALKQLDEELKIELAGAENDEKMLPSLPLKDIKDTIPKIPSPQRMEPAARKAYWQKRKDLF